MRRKKSPIEKEIKKSINSSQKPVVEANTTPIKNRRSRKKQLTPSTKVKTSNRKIPLMKRFSLKIQEERKKVVKYAGHCVKQLDTIKLQSPSKTNTEYQFSIDPVPNSKGGISSSLFKLKIIQLPNYFFQ